MLKIIIREKRYVRRLISLGCSKEAAKKIGKMQRKCWELRASFNEARRDLQTEILLALSSEPDFEQGLKEYLRSKDGTVTESQPQGVDSNSPS